MSNINEFLAFASSASANVESQADYAADAVLYQGFATGVASSLKLNKVWRQSSFITSAIAQFVANTGRNVLDDGNVANFVNLFLNARSAFLNKSVAGNADITLDPVMEANFTTLYLSGLLTGNINVIIPASRQASYNVVNATSGVFTVTFKVAGGTGVLIAQGASSVIASDGISVYLIGSIASGGGGGAAGVIPQNAQNVNYTFTLSDAGRHIYSTTAAAQNLTLPTNAIAAFTIGTAITIVNNGTVAVGIVTTGVTVFKAGNTIAWASGGTLGVKGLVTLLKVDTDIWFISGNGLS